MMAHSTLIIIIMIMEQMILGGVHSNNESKYFFSLYLIGFGTNKYREVNYKFWYMGKFIKFYNISNLAYHLIIKGVIEKKNYYKLWWMHV